MNPYQSLPDKAFWKLAVANFNMFDIDKLWNPKFEIHPKDKVATFGSCFAQHFGNALKKRDFTWHITEPAPSGLSSEDSKKYGYNVFSCRTGNIYTSSLLKQWIEWALEKTKEPAEFWVKKERYYDPFRPNVEPNGFSSLEEMIDSRKQTIKSFAQTLKQSDVFVFTLGLTESWINSEFKYEYPMCPGTVAGEFIEEKHKFKNQQFLFIFKKLEQAILMIREANPEIKILLTVSPVPLTATMSGNHVLVATMESKSILRAVAGQVSNTYDFVDYFPSYEIINSPAFQGVFFEPNKRNVNQYGVDFVMKSFFKALKMESNEVDGIDKKVNESKKNDKEDTICEEELLDAFGGKK